MKIEPEDKTKVKNYFYCEKCKMKYEGDWATEHENKAVCDKCGGELAEIEGLADEGGEGGGGG